MASGIETSISTTFNGVIEMVEATVPVIAAYIMYCVFVRLHLLRKAKDEKAREKQLKDHNKGYPVWFSRHEHLGPCHHLVLYVNGYKYELRLPERDKPPTAPSKSTPIPTWPGRPTGIGFKAIHIGWTNMSHEELQTKSNLLIQNWVYDMFKNNCQHFLHLLTKGMLREKFYPGWREMERQLGVKYDPSDARIAALGLENGLYDSSGDTHGTHDSSAHPQGIHDSSGHHDPSGYQSGIQVSSGHHHGMHASSSHHHNIHVSSGWHHTFHASGGHHGGLGHH